MQIYSVNKSIMSRSILISNGLSVTTGQSWLWSVATTGQPYSNM